MICEVLVKRAVGGGKSFDYETSQLIKPLTLVEVPLGNQIVWGIVIRTKEKSKFPLKPIKRILSAGPILNQLQFDFAKEISKYFLGSLSDTLNRFVPNLNIKDLKLISTKNRAYKRLKTQKPVFIMGERNSRIEHFCQLSDNKQNLLIFPTLKSVCKAENYIKKISPNSKVFVFHSQLKSIQKSEIYQAILNGESCIVISTRHGLFLPFLRLSNVFIDEPFNYAYQEDQAPYYNTFIAARILAKLFGAKLIVSDSCPNLIDYNAIIKNKMDLIELKNNLSFTVFNNPKKITENRFFIELIQKILAEKKLIVFIGNFKDTHKIYCGNCNKKIKCTVCGGENFIEQTNKCNKCHSIIKKCPNCASEKKYYAGLTYANMINQIKKMWPDFSDSIETKVSNFFKKQILVSTYREILMLEKDIDTFIIIDFDQITSSPIFSNRINLFRKILDFKSIGATKIIIFSDEENKYLDDLININWRNFLSRELKDRKINQLPPYSVPVEISCSAKTEELAKSKVEKFSSRLNSKILKFSLPNTKKDNNFIAKQILFLSHNFRETDKDFLDSNDIKIRIGPIDYF